MYADWMFVLKLEDDASRRRKTAYTHAVHADRAARTARHKQHRQQVKELRQIRLDRERAEISRRSRVGKEIELQAELCIAEHGKHYKPESTCGDTSSWSFRLRCQRCGYLQYKYPNDENRSSRLHEKYIGEPCNCRSCSKWVGKESKHADEIDYEVETRRWPI